MIEVKNVLDRIELEASVNGLVNKFIIKFSFTHPGAISSMFPDCYSNNYLNKIREDIWQCLLGNKEEYIRKMKNELSNS